LLEKVVRLSGELFDFARMKNPDKAALDMLNSGKAEKKLRQIIEAQGGDPKIKPEDVPVGAKKATIKSSKPGKVWWINNAAVIEAARAAGAPNDKGAGILFHRKIGDAVRKGEILFEIYAEKGAKLERALSIAGSLDVMGVSRKLEMVMAEIPEEKDHERYFILER
jgi:AMP phosphorylase